MVGYAGLENQAKIVPCQCIFLESVNKKDIMLQWLKNVITFLRGCLNTHRKAIHILFLHNLELISVGRCQKLLEEEMQWSLTDHNACSLHGMLGFLVAIYSGEGWILSTTIQSHDHHACSLYGVLDFCGCFFWLPSTAEKGESLNYWRMLWFWCHIWSIIFVWEL